VHGIDDQYDTIFCVFNVQTKINNNYLTTLTIDLDVASGSRSASDNSPSDNLVEHAHVQNVKLVTIFISMSIYLY